MYKDTNLPLVVVVEAVVVTVVVGIVVAVALSKVKRLLITYFVVTPHSHMHIYLSVCLSILYLYIHSFHYKFLWSSERTTWLLSPLPKKIINMIMRICSKAQNYFKRADAKFLFEPTEYVLSSPV